MQHNICVIRSKLITSQFLSTLEVRKMVVGCALLPGNSNLHPLIKIDYTSLPQSSQAALSVAEPVPTTKMLKKKS